MTIWEAIKEERDRHHSELERQRTRKNLGAQGIMFGTDIAAGLGGRGLVGGLLDSNQQVPGVPIQAIRALGRHMNLDLEGHATKGFPNAAYHPRWMASLQKMPSGQHGAVTVHGRTKIPLDVASHEIGHAMSWNGKAGLLPKAIARARLPAALTMAASPLVGIFGGATGSKPLADREKWLNRASGLAGVGSGAVLADEALASRNAFKVIAKLPPVLRDRVLANAGKRLGRAFGTYGLTGLGLVLGPQLAKQYYRGK